MIENPRSFYLYSVTVDELEKILAKMKHTITDINVMLVNFFITLGRILSYPICKLINLSFRIGIFPIDLNLHAVSQYLNKGISNLQLIIDTHQMFRI